MVGQEGPGSCTWPLPPLSHCCHPRLSIKRVGALLACRASSSVVHAAGLCRACKGVCPQSSQSSTFPCTFRAAEGLDAAAAAYVEAVKSEDCRRARGPQASELLECVKLHLVYPLVRRWEVIASASAASAKTIPEALVKVGDLWLGGGRVMAGQQVDSLQAGNARASAASRRSRAHAQLPF